MINKNKKIKKISYSFVIADLFHYKGEIIWDQNKPNGTPKKLLDIERIIRLGWEPKITLDEGLRQTIRNLKKEIII